MRLVKASAKYVNEISKILFKDLKKYSEKFPEVTMLQFENHAKPKNIMKEFKSPNLIAFLALENKIVIGFVVGYLEGKRAFLQYLTADSKKIKILLLNKFVNECKKLNVGMVKTDTFDFMENKTLFKESGFSLVKSEQLASDLEMLWYEKAI